MTPCGTVDLHLITIVEHDGSALARREPCHRSPQMQAALIRDELIKQIAGCGRLVHRLEHSRFVRPDACLAPSQFCASRTAMVASQG